jgi:hypothetical protein
MSENTRKLLIAAVAAVVLIGGSVAAIALTDDSDDDDRDRPFLALAEEFEGGFEGDELLEQFIERFLEGGDRGALSDRLRDLFGDLRGDLRPPERERPREPEVAPLPEPERDQRRRDEAPRRRARPFREDRDQAAPFRGDRFDGFGFEFGPGGGLPFDLFKGSPLEEFLEDGRITPEERAELERWFAESLGAGGFGFEFRLDDLDRGFVFPEGPGFGLPFGELPFRDFLEDGRISPDEATELDRLLRELFPEGVFDFELAPPATDRPLRALPDALREGLADLPFREFLADGELTPREREALRRALNELIDRLFARFDAGGA